MLICIDDNEIGITHRGLHAKRNKESKRWVRTGIHLAEMPGADFLMELDCYEALPLSRTAYNKYETVVVSVLQQSMVVIIVI